MGKHSQNRNRLHVRVSADGTVQMRVDYSMFHTRLDPSRLARASGSGWFDFLGRAEERWHVVECVCKMCLRITFNPRKELVEGGRRREKPRKSYMRNGLV